MADVLERNGRFVLPALIAAVVVPLALGLQVIGARSPYTHANFDAGVDPNYTRTDQAVVGPPEQFEGDGLAVPPAADPVERRAWSEPGATNRAAEAAGRRERGTP